MVRSDSRPSCRRPHDFVNVSVDLFALLIGSARATGCGTLGRRARSMGEPFPGVSAGPRDLGTRPLARRLPLLALMWGWPFVVVKVPTDSRAGPANRWPSLAIWSPSVTEPGGQPARKRLARAHRSSGTIHPASHGGVAQPGRAPPSHGGSQGFKSPHLHPTRDDQRKRWSSSCPALMRQSA
jgi:hypothetical protein